MGLTAGVAALSSWWLIAAAPAARNSALVGWSIGLALALASGYLVFWSMARAMKSFMVVTLSSMLVRLLVVGAAVAIAVLNGLGHLPSFLVGLLGSHVAYLVLELTILYRITVKSREVGQ